jgi:hypothetical protein
MPKLITVLLKFVKENINKKESKCETKRNFMANLKFNRKKSLIHLYFFLLLSPFNFSNFF